jgi:protein O-GlcNAc transferase
MKDPDDAYARALDLLQSGQLAEAEAGFRSILAHSPRHGQALDGLGSVAARSGRFRLAAEFFALAVTSAPGEAKHLLHLGLALADAGESAMARPVLRRSLALVPGDAQALDALGRSSGETLAFRRSLAVDDAQPAARLNLAGALEGEGERHEARRLLQRALARQPDLGDAWFNLGVLLSSGREAIAAYRRCTAGTSDGSAFVNLGRAEMEGYDGWSRCLKSLRRAIAVEPDLVAAHNEIGRILLSGAEIDSAFRGFLRAVTLAPTDAALHSNLLLSAHYLPEVDLSSLRRAHLQWARRHAQGSPTHRIIVDPSPDRRLRVGYVSADLNRHPVGRFLSPVLSSHDRSEVETVCYAGNRVDDDLTAWLRGAADRWVVTRQMTDGEFRRQVLADQVDILVDLSGHTGGNRLVAMSRRLAPIQVAWIGYPDTTGLATMDFVLGDAAVMPPGADLWFVERIVRLPLGYLCYEPPSYAPEVGPLPAHARGYPTFGSLNNPAKLNRRVFSLWSRILRRIPSARLMLVSDGLADASVRERLRREFGHMGIDPRRIETRRGGRHEAFLCNYSDIDVALDPFPYSGGMTTLEALWMGVPVVSRAEGGFAGRHSVSHLSRAGLGSWVSETDEDYVEAAASAVSDLGALADLRRNLRDRLRTSSLCDAAAFTRSLEGVYRTLWRQACARSNAIATSRP